MLLLGYGLVSIPKTLWREADAGTNLKRSLHRWVQLEQRVFTRLLRHMLTLAACRLGGAATRLLAARAEMQKVSTSEPTA